MPRAVLVLSSPEIRAKASNWIAKAPDRTRVTFQSPTRSLPQNSLLWARLTEVAEKVEWYGQRLSADDWKCVFTAALRKARVVPGLDGGFVVLGLSTSSMSKDELTALLDLVDAFAAERGVVFTA